MKRLLLLISCMIISIIVLKANIIIPPTSELLLVVNNKEYYLKDSILVSPINNGFYYCHNYDSILYFFDGNSFESKQIANVHAPLSALTTKGADCIVAYERVITKVDTQNNRLIPITYDQEEITTITTGFDDSYFYGTANKLYFITPDKVTIEIATQGVNDLFRTDSTLFVTFADSTMWAISHCNAYNEWAKEVRLSHKNRPITIDGYSTTIINDGDSLDLSDISYTTIPGSGLFGIIGNSLISMETDRETISEYTFPDSTYFAEQVEFLPSLVVYKSGKSILHVNERKRTHKFELDTDSFTFSYATDTSIYIFAPGLVFECNPRRGEPHIVFKAPSKDQILTYAPYIGGILVAFGNKLCMVKDKRCEVLITLPTNMTDANISSHGVLLGSSNGLYIYSGGNKLRCISEKPIKQILNDGDYLYIITENSSIYRLKRIPNNETHEKVKSKNR